jgi:hypothetical protein
MSADESLSEYVRFVSYDGFEFIIRREAANISGHLNSAFDPKSAIILSLFPPLLVGQRR